MKLSHHRAILNYYEELLFAIFLFMLRDKERSPSVVKLVQRQLSLAEMEIAKEQARKTANSDVLGAALHEWYRNTAYLDQSFSPRPLPLHGPKPSVSALIRLQDSKSDADRVAKEMLRLGLIRRVSRGSYMPVARVATIRSLSPASIEHVSRSLERLLATVTNQFID